MRQISRAVSVICVIALMVTAFSGVGYGEDPVPEYKVSFYQLSMTPEGGFTSPGGVSIEYAALTQFVADGDPARNPGAVAYAVKDSPAQHFMGWYEFGAPDDNPYDFGRSVTGNLSLFARFTEDWLVTFLNGFGESFLTKRVTPSAIVSEPTEGEMSLFTAPSGIRFDDDEGWKKDGAKYAFDTSVTEDITLTPSLVEGASVYFVSAGSQVPFETANQDGKVSEPTPPTRTGYTFARWSTTEGGSTSFDFNTEIEEDTTLYAVWTPENVDYTVVVWTEKKNIAGDAGMDPANYEYTGQFTQTKTIEAGSSTDTLVQGAQNAVEASPVKPPSWSAFGFASATSKNVLGNGATILNVYYKRVVYNFSFTPYDRGTSTTSNATLTLGGRTYTDASRYGFSAKYEQDVAAKWPVSPLAQLSAPGNASLHFQGWKVPNGKSIFVSKVITISLDLLPASGTNQTITANWITTGMMINLNYMFETPDGKNMPGAVLYNGKYYVRDETYSQSSYSTGTPFALKEIKGMTPLTTNALTKTATGFAVPTEKTFADQYLFYNRAAFTISFQSQGGAAVQSVTGLLAGTPLASKKPTDPKRTDVGSTYVFDGWYTGTDYMTRFDFASETMPDSNLILYAKWTQDPFTVSVYDGLANAVLLGTYTRAKGEYVGDPKAALAAEGVNADYTVGTLYADKGEFQGWVIPLGPGEKAVLSAELPVTGDLSVYADWKPQTFTVTYSAGEATGNPPKDDNEYLRGAEARVLQPTGAAIGDGSLVPPEDGGDPPQDMVFAGWLDANGHIHYPGETITVTGDTVLTASYTALDKFVVYTYHINYPDDAQDSSGSAITDPGNLKQYVGQGQGFPVLGYDAYSPTPEPESYRFAGWATSSAIAAEGTVTYKGGQRSTAPTSSALRIDLDMWAVWTHYLSVTFDAGGVYGNLASGGAIVNYQVVSGSSLNASDGVNLQSVPAVTVKGGYAFIGWALDDEWPTTMDNGDILDAQVTTSLTYKAVYAAFPATDPSAVSYGVTFDAGGVYGNLTEGGSGVTYEVAAGKTLSDLTAAGGANLSTVPVITVEDGYEFTGWALDDEWPATTSTAIILNATVNAPMIYRAVYAALASGVPGAHAIGVTFDAGGVYGNLTGGGTNITYAVLYEKTLKDTIAEGGANLSAAPEITVESGY
ncbi:MAG: InlB B-repeat-containing protein, partial [Clostridiales Family XIII bacterium]|nr:InlB B-repeat-containing protein [Clostridiales Family XIII bacterium]